MIGAIDSYLQIVSALYLSVCLDNHFCRHIWHPEFSDKTEKFLNENPFWKTHDLISLIKETTDSKFNNLAARARQRGGFMFAVCMLLILYAIFEPNLSRGMPAEAFSLLAFLGCVFIVSTLQIYIKFNFIASTIALALCSAAYSFCHHCLRTSIWDNSYNIWVTLVAICIISTPLLYQFLWHRLTNSFFMAFWENRLEQERRYYEEAKYKEKNGGEIESLQPEYKAYFANCHINNRGTQDQQMEGLNKCFFKRLAPQSTPPGLTHLLIFRITLSAKSLFAKVSELITPSPIKSKKTCELIDFKTPVRSQETPIFPQSKLEYFYQIYGTSQPIPKLKDFCKKNNLDYKEFRTYFRQRRAAISAK